MSILKLQPDNFTENPWGGRWMPEYKGLPRRPALIGEAWEFSGHEAHPSFVEDESGKKTALPELIAQWGQGLFGSGISGAPFLLKFIDAKEDLSIQVHPDEDYAMSHESDHGKRESWVVLETTTPSAAVYVGFNPEYADRFESPEKFKAGFRQALDRAAALGVSDLEAIQERAAKFILPFLNRIVVRPGDVIVIPPGVIHAIGRGVRLFEAQQNSNVTYRIWDWNRPDRKSKTPVSRPLHLDKAFEVLDFQPHAASEYRKTPEAVATTQGAEEMKLIHWPEAGFAVNRVSVQESTSLDIAPDGKFYVLTVVSGMLKWSDDECRTGHSILLPADRTALTLQSGEDGVVFLKTTNAS